MTEVNHFNFNQVVAGGSAVVLQGDDNGGACDSDIGACINRNDVPRVIDGQMSAAASSSYQNAQGIEIIDFVDTAWIDHVIDNQMTVGLIAYCPTSHVQSACPQFGSIIRLETEVNGTLNGNGYGIRLTDAIDFSIIDPQIYGYSMVNGIYIGNVNYASYNIKISDGKINTSSSHCVITDATSGVSIQNMKMLNCGGSSNYAIEQTSSNGAYSQINFSNNIFCNDLGNVYASGGISLASAGDYVVVQGNNFKGCTNTVSNSSGGSHNSIANNTPN
jgi:hypothetical protein